MKVTLVQTQLHWENREKNISHFNNLLGNLKDETNLVVLPEMFTTGFTMNPEKNAEAANGETLAWLKQKATEKKAVITGSVAVNENKNYYNRLFWVEPSGNFSIYNKRHLFRMANEEQHYTPGDKKLITPINGWNFCAQVCYDLRFPVWSRNTFNSDKGWQYDVLVYVANWPEIRSYPWKQLLIARAIENQCYVVGLNRIGKDGNGYDHSGDSVVINPRGEIISKTKPHEESIETVYLDRAYLDEYRKIFPVGWDADGFEFVEKVKPAKN